VFPPQCKTSDVLAHFFSLVCLDHSHICVAESYSTTGHDCAEACQACNTTLCCVLGMGIGQCIQVCRRFPGLSWLSFFSGLFLGSPLHMYSFSATQEHVNTLSQSFYDAFFPNHFQDLPAKFLADCHCSIKDQNFELVKLQVLLANSQVSPSFLSTKPWIFELWPNHVYPIYSRMVGFCSQFHNGKTTFVTKLRTV
jgi:hypothetical protein